MNLPPNLSGQAAEKLPWKLVLEVGAAVGTMMVGFFLQGWLRR